MRATAFLRTSGQAKAAIRLRFWSTAEGGWPVVVFSGTTPQAYEEYTEVSLVTGVPSGCDHAAVEILGLLPDSDSEVLIDDVALREGQGESHSFTTKAGQRVAGCGGSLVVLDANSIVMSGLRPLTTDPGLLELDKLGLLGLSDTGMGLEVKDADGAVKLHVTGGVGLSLTFDAGVASSGALARKGDAEFVNHGSPFDLADVDNLLIGYGTSRLLVQLPAPAAMKSLVGGGRFVLSLPDSSGLSLVYDFADSRQKARTLLSEAQARFADGNYAVVMSKVDQALHFYPHDDRLQHEVTKLRTRVRNLQSDRVRYLDAELDNVVYFESLGGYNRIRQQLGDLTRVYGQANLLQPDKVAAMRKRVDETIARIEATEGSVARQKLQTLAAVYGKAGSAELVALINQYIKDYLPAVDKEEDK